MTFRRKPGEVAVRSRAPPRKPAAQSIAGGGGGSGNPEPTTTAALRSTSSRARTCPRGAEDRGEGEMSEEEIISRARNFKEFYDTGWATVKAPPRTWERAPPGRRGGW